tara:strand:+ start:184 stop:384 length:201 start_codon:yes stop_codon:yes gene_type:complete
MADVIKPVIPANSVKNGAAITLSLNTGEYERVDNQISDLQIASGTTNQRLKTRFDDPRYYTGDANS